MQCTSSVGSVLLEIRRCSPRHLLRCAVEVVSQLSDQPAMLVDQTLKPFGLLDQLALGIRCELAEPLADSRELPREALLELLEIGAPAREPLLDAALRPVERLRELRGGVAFTLRNVAAALLGDASFLVQERGQRLGACDRQRLLQIGCTLLDLVRHDLVELRFRVLELFVRRAVA